MQSNVLELRRRADAAPSDSGPGDGAIRACADIGDAARALAVAARRHGLRLMLWHNLATLEPMCDAAGDPINPCVFGWEDATLAHWRAMDAAVRSPLLKACRVASEPVWINRHGAAPEGSNRFLDQIDFAGFEHYVAAHAAIIMPVRLPFGYLAAAILTSLDPAKDDLSAEFDVFAETLAQPIEQFLRRYAALTFDERYLPTEDVLSSREIECLNWVAQGKTDYEISIILGCSHAGIRYHITRAGAKLGAVNRAQSVFKACQLGYLGVPSRRLEDTPARSAVAG